MSEKRMFEFVEGSSSKFWEIWRIGTEVRTRYGKIGSDGQTTVKDEGDDAKAQKLYDKLVKEKTGKGYVEKTAGAASTSTPSPAAPVAVAAVAPAQKPPQPLSMTGEGSVGAAGAARRFEMDEKFWEISLDGASHTVRFGKIGASGQAKTKDFDDAAAAQKDHDKLIKEKTGKGYVETSAPPASTSTASPSVAAPAPAPAAAEPQPQPVSTNATSGGESGGAAGAARRFEMEGKFWEIALDGASHTVRFGKQGTDGQEKTKTFDTAAAAKKDHDSLIKEKTGKGYVETSSTSAPSSSSSSSSSSPAPSKKKTPLHPWLSSQLGYRTADFDADDVYVFSCRVNDDDDFAVHFTGTADDGDFVCAADAIAGGSEKIHLAQGGATFSQTVEPVDAAAPAAAFPPFLLSRALFATLKSGGTIAWPTVLTGDGKTVPVTRTGASTHSVTVNGKKQTVKTVTAAGSDVRLTILDDGDWPLVLIDDEADECGWWLKAVGNDLDVDALQESIDNDDDDDDDGGGDGDGDGGGARRFEMDEKFWEITLDGASHTVRYGKIGTDGQEKTKTFDDEDAAKKDAEKLIKEKTGKGYEEVGGDD